jgi:pyruvate carboxylase
MAFIGPSHEVIDALGDKTKARDIARKAGVQIVPGTPGPVANYKDGEAFVKEHGFPGAHCTAGVIEYTLMSI